MGEKDWMEGGKLGGDGRLSEDGKRRGKLDR